MARKKQYRYAKMYKGIRIDLRSSSQEELMEKVAEKKRLIDGGGLDMTVSALCDKWIRLREPHVKDSTIKGYNTYIKRLKTVKKKVTDVHSSDLQELINAEIPNNRSREFYKKFNTIIKSVFSLAIKDRIIVFDPSLDLIVPNGTKKERRALTEEERKIFLAAVKRSDHAMAFIPMLYCGLRPSEVRRLQGKHIDIANKVIHVPGTKSAAAVRDVPIPEAVIFRFAGYKPEQYIITTRTGNRVTGDRFGVWWNTLWMDMNRIAGAKFFRGALVDPVIDPNITSYYLRHTYCTDLERAGVPVTVACRLMGHSSIDITQRIYTHANPDSFNAAADKLNKLHSQNGFEDGIKARKA